MAWERFPKFFYTFEEATKFAQEFVGDWGVYEIKTCGSPAIEVPGPLGMAVWQRVPNVAVFYDRNQ